MEQKQKIPRKERISRISMLMKALKDIPETQRQQIADNLGIVNVEGRTLSPSNQILISLQLEKFSVVGGFKQWLKAGRCVRKGEHGALIFFPVGNKDENGDVTEAEKFFVGVVFDVSQTEEISQN